MSDKMTHCGHDDEAGPHACPFACESYKRCEDRCYCCDDCTRRCADAV